MLASCKRYICFSGQRWVHASIKPEAGQILSRPIFSILDHVAGFGKSFLSKLPSNLTLRPVTIGRVPKSTHLHSKPTSGSSISKNQRSGLTWRAPLTHTTVSRIRPLVSTISKRHYAQWDFRNQYGNWNYRESIRYVTGPSALSGLIAANVAVYFLWFTVGSTNGGHKWMTDNWMVSASTWQSHPWTLLTSSISHSSFLHLLFNMFAIGTIGRDIQTLLGPRGFLMLCGATAVAGSLGHLAWSTSRMPAGWTPRSEVIPVYILPDGTPLLQNQVEAYTKVHGRPNVEVRHVFMSEDHVWEPALGASAVASGLFGMSAVLWPRRQFVVLVFTTHASRLLLYFAGFSTLSLLLNPESRIGHAAHLSGLGVGVLAAVLLRGRAIRFIRP